MFKVGDEIMLEDEDGNIQVKALEEGDKITFPFTIPLEKVMAFKEGRIGDLMFVYAKRYWELLEAEFKIQRLEELGMNFNPWNPNYETAGDELKELRKEFGESNGR